MKASNAVHDLLGLASSVWAASPYAQQAPSVGAGPQTQDVWDEHLTLTRGTLRSALAGLPDADALMTGLMRLDGAIGEVVRPYATDAAGRKLSAVLRLQTSIAAEVIKAAGDGKPQLAEMESMWSTNGEELAELLAGADAASPKRELTALLEQHRQLTAAAVASRQAHH
jgi:hypothetical protein